MENPFKQYLYECHAHIQQIHEITSEQNHTINFFAQGRHS